MAKGLRAKDNLCIRRIAVFMGKQIKKVHEVKKKKSKWERTCERCGNEVFSPRPIFKCRYCKWWNGVGNE